MTLTQCHLGKDEVTGSKSAFVSGLFSFLCRNKKDWKFLPHTNIAYDLRMCHEFDPGSFWQVQGHLEKKFIICDCFKLLLWRNIGSFNFIERLLMTKDVS